MVNLDPEQLKTAGEPLVVVAVAAVGGERLRDGAADTDHYREKVDADMTDPAVEHGDQGDLAAVVERGAQDDPGDRTAVAGAAVGAAVVDAVELSSLERSGPTHLQGRKRVNVHCISMKI